jgi:hypothetical protein
VIARERPQPRGIEHLAGLGRRRRGARWHVERHVVGAEHRHHGGHALGAAPRDHEADIDRQLGIDAGRRQLGARHRLERALGPGQDIGHGFADLGREDRDQIDLGDEPRHQQDFSQRHAGFSSCLQGIGERSLGHEATAHQDHAELLFAAVRARPDDAVVLDDEAAHQPAALERDRRGELAPGDPLEDVLGGHGTERAPHRHPLSIAENPLHCCSWPT